MRGRIGTPGLRSGFLGMVIVLPLLMVALCNVTNVTARDTSIVITDEIVQKAKEIRAEIALDHATTVANRKNLEIERARREEPEPIPLGHLDMFPQAIDPKKLAKEMISNKDVPELFEIVVEFYQTGKYEHDGRTYR